MRAYISKRCNSNIAVVVYDDNNNEVHYALHSPKDLASTLNRYNVQVALAYGSQDTNYISKYVPYAINLEKQDVYLPNTKLSELARARVLASSHTQHS